MDEVTKAKFQEVLKDEAFVKELVALETPEDVQAKLKERGVDVTVKDVEALRNSFAKAAEGEMTDDALESVAGGMTFQEWSWNIVHDTMNRCW